MQRNQELLKQRQSLDERTKFLWKENPQLHKILQEAPNLEALRTDLFRYLARLERKQLNTPPNANQLDSSLALKAIQVARLLFSRRGEGLSQQSTLRSLWRLSQGKRDDFHWGFVAEMFYLFRAARGEADSGQGWLGEQLGTPHFFKGREGGLQRSHYLDRLDDCLQEYLCRYEDGQRPDTVAAREENIQKILEHFGATREEWQDWRWHLRHILQGKEGLEHLQQLVPLSDEDRQACHLALQHGIPFGITPYYLSLFDFHRADRQRDRVVRAQVLPPLSYVETMVEHKDDRSCAFDFMGEHDTSPHDLITRRYPQVSILKPFHTCPQICVYCQRNWEITDPLSGDARVPEKTLQEAISWIEEHKAIIDVLVTGGDPLMLGDERLERTLQRLSEIDHISLIRIGTRIPVTLPQRLTPQLARMLGSYIEPGKRNLCLVTHIEDAQEITPALIEAVTLLRQEGISVYNQMVYSAYVSRRFQAVHTRIALKKAGIDPYYTFYPKGKEEHRAYILPLARIVQERKEESRLLPGQFRTDEPVFNVPRLGKTHTRAYQDRELVGILPDGCRVYLWHPWEKGISRASCYTQIDSSIAAYLEFLQSIGESPADYASIWYYY